MTPINNRNKHNNSKNNNINKTNNGLVSLMQAVRII